MAAMTPRPVITLPESCGVAFKEWAGVCEALAEGRQALILRKGGIAEGPCGFVPEHPVFWLYPTHVHQAEQGLRTAPGRPSAGPSPAGTVAVGVLAVVETIDHVDRPNVLLALEHLHIWTAETVRKRFAYRRPGLWVLGVRVYRLGEPAVLAVTPEQAGCTSWVPIDPPLGTAGLVPVLDDAEAACCRDRLRSALVGAP
jgi:hypothetical protein